MSQPTVRSVLAGLTVWLCAGTAHADYGHNCHIDTTVSYPSDYVAVTGNTTEIRSIYYKRHAGMGVWPHKCPAQPLVTLVHLTLTIHVHTGSTATYNLFTVSANPGCALISATQPNGRATLELAAFDRNKKVVDYVNPIRDFSQGKKENQADDPNHPPPSLQGTKVVNEMPAYVVFYFRGTCTGQTGRPLR
jgi:hypothetical protein